MDAEMQATRDAVMDYLRKHAPEAAAALAKQQPGAGDVHAPTALGNSVTSDLNGNFSLASQFTCPTTGNAGNTLVYITATGGDAGGGPNNQILMMTALGACSNLTTDDPEPTESIVVCRFTFPKPRRPVRRRARRACPSPWRV